MKKWTFVLLCLFLSIGLASAQTKVFGVVLSAEDGQPVIGASVVVKGTSTGTVTDTDGKFSLSVPASGKTLVVSYVGMESQELAVKSSLRAVLKSKAKTLDEVVVTAMGIKRSEKSLGYAATTVGSKELTATGNRSAINALQGKVAGVEINSASGSPGASTRVVLRGFSSLGGSNQPLYVIDGVPVNNDVVNATSINGGVDFGNRANDINPDDIETLTVLKGGSATILYGSRAANGVIVITTKNGSKSNNKAKIDISSTYTFENPLKLPQFQNDFGQGWYDAGGTSTNLEENGSWGPRFDGVTRIWGHVVDNQQQIKPYSALPTNVKDFFDTGITTNNTISISNGDSNKSFYLSYGNINNDGIMPSNSDSYRRNNFTVKGNSNFLKIFNASASLNFVRKDSKFVPTGQQQSVLDGLWQTSRDMSIVDLKDYNNKFNNVDNYFTVYAQNPYFVLNEHGNKFVDNRLFGSFNLDAKLLPWLTATMSIGEDVSNSTLKTWRAIFNSSRADYEKEVGRVGESSFYSSEFTTDFKLKVDKTFDNFSIIGVLGHNFNQRDARSQSAEVVGLDIPNFYNLSNSSSTPSVSEFTSLRRLVGVYGSLDLGYKSLVYLNLSARNDWSSTLPKDNRSFFYPGASLSFIFSELLGSDAKDIFSYGKIRAGVAQTGNDADPYLINSVLVQASHTDGYRNLDYPLSGGVNGFSVSNRIGNSKLQPEISTDMEIGTEMKFFKNRFGVDLTLYNKTATELIWPATIPSSTGFTTQMLNLGKITNKGVELSLSYTPIKTNNLEWEIFANYTKNKNKLEKLVDGLDQISLGGTSSVNFMARPGNELGLFEGNVLETDPQGHTVVDAQGLPVFKSEKGYLGSSQNDFRIGGGTSITYKNFSLRAIFDYRKGGYMYSRTAELLYFTGNAPQTTYNDRQPFIIPNSVQKLSDGTYIENTTPIAAWDHNLNSFYNQSYNAGVGGAYSLVDKTFFKLREVTLSYTLPKKILAKSFISSAQISLVGRNLFIWTPSSNVFSDPEQTTFGNDMASSFGDYGATPSTRSIGFSVKLGL